MTGREGATMELTVNDYLSKLRTAVEQLPRSVVSLRLVPIRETLEPLGIDRA